MLATAMRKAARLDHDHIWHPFTQQRDWVAEEPLMIESAEGTVLIDTEGRRYLDGVSSLWCNVHGHRHPDIDAAVREQLDRVAHSTMLGLSHPGAAELAGRLVDIAPPGLNRVFYSDSGSTAVEVALKMAFQYQQHRGGQHVRKTSFICLEDAYHVDDIARLLAMREEEVAAVVLEPLVQGAAGMITHPPGYLRAVRRLCDRHGALLICDEVATGFGRTGTMFACEQEGVSPDLLCVAKGLTGGYLPLAATMATERIYQAFLGAHSEYKTFFHGHTYTGNPLACAAALASLEVFRRERTLVRIQPKIRLLSGWLSQVERMREVKEVRQCGLMVGIDLGEHDPELQIGHRVVLEARRRGVVVRPLGDVIVLMPPLSISKQDLRRLVEVVGQSIRAAYPVAELDSGARGRLDAALLEAA